MVHTNDFNALSSFADPNVMRERTTDFAQQMREIEDQQARGVQVEPYKLFGFLTMPPMVGAMLKTIVNPAVMEGAVYLQEHTGDIIAKHGHKVFKNPQHAVIASQGAALAVGLGTQLSEHGVTFWNNLSHYKRSVSTMAANIAPVLKEIKGGNGFTSFLSVSPEDNEVIYAYRRRLGDDHGRSHMHNAIGMIDKLPGVLRSLSSVDGLRDRIKHLNEGNPDSPMRKMLVGASGGLGPMVVLYQDSLKRELNRDRGKTSALVMITDLQESLRNDPNAQDFEVHGARNQQVSLTDYIALTFKCHQEDMAKLDADCSPIRKQLDKRLFEVADRLADAIRQGEISPLMLVRLVGERQIVKRGGRDIASMKDVEAAIRKCSGKVQSYNHVPEKEFFESFTKQDVKKALDTLKGEERDMFMATLPDNILQAEGVSDKEIHAMREATGPKYKQMLAHAVAGLAVKNDEALEAMGLQADEIAQARKAAQAIADEGIGAIDRLRASPTNTAGVEGLVHQAVVGSGAKVSFAELAKGGKAALTKAAADGQEKGGFAERERERRAADISEERGLHS